MSSKKTKSRTAKKRPQRATSNVFAMFDQSQIQEFKEAFNMIDQNRDGFVDKEDLHDMLASLGESATRLQAVQCFIGFAPTMFTVSTLVLQTNLTLHQLCEAIADVFFFSIM